MENEDGVQERTIPQNNQGKYQPSNKTQPVKSTTQTQLMHNDHKAAEEVRAARTRAGARAAENELRYQSRDLSLFW